VLLAVSVRTLDPPLGTETGLYDAVTPVGKEGADRVTESVKDPVGATVTVVVRELPWTM
jgi:hypothetical protein